MPSTSPFSNRTQSKRSSSFLQVPLLTPRLIRPKRCVQQSGGAPTNSAFSGDVGHPQTQPSLFSTTPSFSKVNSVLALSSATFLCATPFFNPATSTTESNSDSTPDDKHASSTTDKENNWSHFRMKSGRRSVGEGEEKEKREKAVGKGEGVKKETEGGEDGGEVELMTEDSEEKGEIDEQNITRKQEDERRDIVTMGMGEGKNGEVDKEREQREGGGEDKEQIEAGDKGIEDEKVRKNELNNKKEDGGENINELVDIPKKKKMSKKKRAALRKKRLKAKKKPQRDNVLHVFTDPMQLEMSIRMVGEKKFAKQIGVVAANPGFVKIIQELPEDKRLQIKRRLSRVMKGDSSTIASGVELSDLDTDDRRSRHGQTTLPGKTGPFVLIFKRILEWIYGKDIIEMAQEEHDTKKLIVEEALQKGVDPSTLDQKVLAELLKKRKEVAQEMVGDLYSPEEHPHSPPLNAVKVEPAKKK